ncbi:branched-chain amino acid ABC transporter substrate-binding protein [Paraburkholderia acidisoli]|uniref:ABC transporter substrate-binding protein n=1 Tax=Paraburkholderia acidisoli TaxID=2571748 RepID=A0A7Z2JIJ0_9BURK|nr:branched-chain amino acid ABC transporter substrate-binding protein [Paraburkholderia acidisoli]QGZ65766.1 ABC transporter substrate-binding protein [Paraburkholderia acidisoli]
MIAGGFAHAQNASAATPATGPRTILIGVAGPLTGPSARIGKDLENGARLAIDDANAKHPTLNGQPVKFALASVDDASDPRVAVTVAQQLVDQHVVGVVGHWNTGCSVPASRVYNAAGIPEIAPASTGHQYTLQGYNTAFRIMGHDDLSGAITGEYAVKTLKGKHIGVIDDRTAFGSGLATQFVKGVEANGGTVVDHEYVDDKTVDFSGVLTTLKSKGVDVLFFGGLDTEEAQVARRMKQLNIKATLLGAGGTSHTFVKLAGDASEGVIALEPGRPLEEMPGGKAFDAAYRAKYHHPVELHAPFAYDAAATIIAAVEQTQSTDPAKLTAAVHAISRQGVTGTIAFDAQGNLRDPAFTIFKVSGGEWKIEKLLGGETAVAAK